MFSMIADKRVRLASTLVLVMLLAGGCDTTSERPSDATSDQGAACRDALRDIRTWCSGGILESQSGLRYNCLEARLRFDRSCYPR